MKEPLVSIIVPIYNVEKFLPACLDSIITQSYSNIEVILVDDGSPDKSGDIADEYSLKDSRLKVIHKINKGVSSARNSGIEIASGEYLCFADSDDILEHDYVEYLLTMALNNDADIALTTSMFSSYGDRQVPTEYCNVVSGEEAALSILHYFIPIGCYCKLFSSRLLDNGVRFIPEVYIGEGFNFNVDAFIKAKRVAIGNRKIYKYRRDNNESAMTQFRADKCSMALKAIDLIHNKLPKDAKFEDAYKYAKWHTASNMHDWILMSRKQKEYPELYKECRKWVKRYSIKALSAKSPKSDKIRAILQSIHPSLVPVILKARRKIYLS